MFQTLQELEAEEAHWQELREYAEQERLIHEAPQPEGKRRNWLLDRLLQALKERRRQQPPSDPRLN